jgi:hypothetical protein
MIRRQFFVWLGKVSVALGLGYLALGSEESEASLQEHKISARAERHHRMRMNGRACHDYRMVSGDRSMILDEEFLR